ncbi:MAG: hypothetical protein AAF125_00395 [Chloroflexota bacterium]
MSNSSSFETAVGGTRNAFLIVFWTVTALLVLGALLIVVWIGNTIDSPIIEDQDDGAYAPTTTFVRHAADSPAFDFVLDA